jgi:hypothetical protein
VAGCVLALWVAGCAGKTKLKPMICDQGSICQDSDCDTICDIDEGFETERDTDHDGTPDYLDTDSDNDGISDYQEAGDDDPATPPFDRNEDGILDYLDALFPLHAPGSEGSMDASMPAMTTPPPPPPDKTPPTMTLPPPPTEAGNPRSDAGNPYEVDGGTIATVLCPADHIVPAGCAPNENDAAACDGLDNDCDGRVDNDNFCTCQRGAVRHCFAGPPGRRHVGGCQDGTQVCVGDEFAHWGACVDGTRPQAEICDGLDNDCNGCSDELAGCASKLTCPAPGDPRTPDAQPWLPYALDATRFYDGNDALAYRWEIRGSPCDRYFQTLDSSATPQSGKLSFYIANTATAQTNAVFTLSGSYEVTLIVTTPLGEIRCQWFLHVRAPGLRVELCWDKTGPIAQTLGNAVDLDLHLGKQGKTSGWDTTSDCYWKTCRGDKTPFNYANTTALSTCTGPNAQNYAAYSVIGFCPNPRLDADNRLDSQSRATYIPENINLDNPSVGDQFRVMVQYNTNVLADSLSADAGTAPSIAAHPIVNVYCAGELRGSFGGDPEQTGDAEELEMSQPGAMWRVADIAISSAGCALTPLHSPLPGGGYWLSGFDTSYGAQ